MDLLRLGLSRREAARRLGVCAATITKLMQRDEALSRQIASAEIEGANFKRVFENAFLPGRVMIMPYAVLSTAYFEKEKAYLIARGLPANYVKRLRLCSVEEMTSRWERAEQVEKEIALIEKEAEKPVVRRPKVRRETKIVRRQFFNKSGQPVEVVRYVVEERDVSDRQSLRGVRRLSRKIERMKGL